jgi:hypothetical protein
MIKVKRRERYYAYLLRDYFNSREENHRAFELHCLMDSNDKLMAAKILNWLNLFRFAKTRGKNRKKQNEHTRND